MAYVEVILPKADRCMADAIRGDKSNARRGDVKTSMVDKKWSNVLIDAESIDGPASGMCESGVCSRRVCQDFLQKNFRATYLVILSAFDGLEHWVQTAIFQEMFVL